MAYVHHIIDVTNNSAIFSGTAEDKDNKPVKVILKALLVHNGEDDDELKALALVRSSKYVVHVYGKIYGKELKNCEYAYSLNGDDYEQLIHPETPMVVMKRYRCDLLKWRNFNPVSSCNLKRLVRRLLRGLKEIHTRNVIHCDIKLKNILCDYEGKVEDNIVYTDFGSARTVVLQEDVDDLLTTYAFRAPERFAKGGFRELTRKCDVYSLGCTIFSFITGRLLFPREEVYFAIRQRQYYVDRLKCSKKVRESGCLGLLVGMLRYKSKERFSVDDCLNHKWLKE